MTEKTGYKFYIGVDQSVSNGMIKFSGAMYFDDFDDYENIKDKLWEKIHEQDELFRNNGFRTACEIPNNMDKLATKNAQAKLGKDQEKKIVKDAGSKQ